MLSRVKLALRITTNAFDDEINGLIRAALMDLGLVGIEQALLTNGTTDELIKTAVITYVKLHFGEPSDPERLKRSYDEQKAQLITATGYGLLGGCYGQI
jgi:hypothetical protein